MNDPATGKVRYAGSPVDHLQPLMKADEVLRGTGRVLCHPSMWPEHERDELLPGIDILRVDDCCSFELSYSSQ